MRSQVNAIQNLPCLKSSWKHISCEYKQRGILLIIINPLQNSALETRNAKENVSFTLQIDSTDRGSYLLLLSRKFSFGILF